MQRPHIFSFLALLTVAGLFSSPVRLEAQQPDSPLLASFEQYRQMKEDSEFRLEWIPLGPVMNSARVEAVQGIPGDPATIYVALGSGNLWKTVDGGLTWLDTLSVRYDERRHRQLKAVFRAARAKIETRLHNHAHAHGPAHEH